MAVDRRWRLYVDPDVLRQWTVQQAGAVLIHEVNHLLRDHAGRAEVLGVGDGDAMAWNLAADAEINDDLLDLRLPLPGGPVTPGSLGCPKHRLAEEYFAKVPARLQGGIRQDSGLHSNAASEHLHRHPDCGSGAHGQWRDWESTGDDGLGTVDADLVRREVAEAVIQASATGGHFPQSLRRWAEERLTPEIDWRLELNRQLRRSVAWSAGAVDFTMTRRSRRAGSVDGVVLAGLGHPVPEIAVVADTSASMTRSDLDRVVAEIGGLLRSVGVRRQATVLAVDTAVRRRTRVKRTSDIELVGGGGTELGVGIEAAARLRPRPSTIVVLTDGFTDWPDRAPAGIDVVVGLIGDPVGDSPRWARTVDIGEDG